MQVLIVDDHEVVRKGIRSLLSNQVGFEICGEAVDGQDACEKARESKPDLIIMDGPGSTDSKRRAKSKHPSRLQSFDREPA